MIFADLHIHIGQSLDGRAVKITAAKTLTLPNILEVARDVKGLSMIGVVDMHSTGVQRDVQTLLTAGALHPLSGGGYEAGGLTLIPGHEIELQIGDGNAHFLAYFPTLAHVERYVQMLRSTIKNWQLSSQKGFITVDQWLEAVWKAEGVWFPAHAFTPHKGIYGNCCRRLRDVLPVSPEGLEIGLSADRQMARSISELDDVVLFSNSDAHSLPNIAREYNALDHVEASFAGLVALMKGTGGATIRNYGLPPVIGKYHRTYCLRCEKVIEAPAPQLTCPECGSSHVVMGVFDRLMSIADRPLSYGTDAAYVYHVPLRQLPGVGPKMVERLLKAFGTEMEVLHHVREEDLERVAGEKIADWIIKARNGQIKVHVGGGGVFGRVVDILSLSVE